MKVTADYSTRTRVEKKTMPLSRAGGVALSSKISILTSAYIIADEPPEVEISIGVLSPLQSDIVLRILL